jgi:hypothetical protein
MHFETARRVKNQAGTLALRTDFPHKPGILSLGAKDIDGKGILEQTHDRGFMRAQTGKKARVPLHQLRRPGDQRGVILEIQPDARGFQVMTQRQ